MQSQKIADYVSLSIPGLCYFPTQIKTKSFYKNSYKYSTLVVKSNEINTYNGDIGHQNLHSSFTLEREKQF
jgi:hypothetical protein